MVTITVNGTEYRLARADTKVLERFIEWANAQLPDPIDAVREQIKGFPTEIQLEMVRSAQREKALRRSGQSQDVQAMLATPAGVRKLFALVLQKHHGNLTDSEVIKIIGDCEEEHGIEYLNEAFGQVFPQPK